MSRFFLSISRTKIKKNPRNEKKSECLSVQNVYGYICIYIYISGFFLIQQLHFTPAFGCVHITSRRANRGTIIRLQFELIK